MDKLPNCPKCNSEYTYEDGNLFVCPECANEWTAESQKEAEEAALVRDVNGNILETGDSVTVIKDINVKSATSNLKMGTRIKNIRIVDGADNHNLEAKVEGFGVLLLKSQFVKKL